MLAPLKKILAWLCAGGRGEAGEALEDGANGSRRALRTFLCWALALAFLWEAVLRPVALAVWPDLAWPESALGDVLSLLCGLLGI